MQGEEQNSIYLAHEGKLGLEHFILITKLERLERESGKIYRRREEDELGEEESYN